VSNATANQIDILDVCCLFVFVTCQSSLFPALPDFQGKLERHKTRLLAKGLSLEDCQLYYACHKHDLRLRKRREAGDRLPVFIFVKKGPALSHMISLRVSRGWAKHVSEGCCMLVDV
jgi:hypothetical protein